MILLTKSYKPLPHRYCYIQYMLKITNWFYQIIFHKTILLPVIVKG